MKILLPTVTLPHSNHSIRAANVVLFQLISSLLDHDGIDLHLLPISLDGQPFPADEQANRGLDELRQRGLKVDDPIVLSNLPSQRSRLGKLLFPRAEDYFPVIEHAKSAQSIIEVAKPDWVITVWSETLTDLFASAECKLLAYYGNPIPKNTAAQNNLARRDGRSLWGRAIDRLREAQTERFHLKIMRGITVMKNVAANDADYYFQRGIGNAEYINNLWIQRFPNSTILNRLNQTDGVRVAQIAASVGKLGGTANSHGFIFLTEQLLPELRRAFNGRPFKLHIFGSGVPHPAVADGLSEPEIVMRGFVDDIDEELMACPVFLCCNNASNYNVGHTRYLHAWSLGRCVASHINVREAMPELIDGHNAVLGTTAKEMADKIMGVFEDPDMLHRLSVNGLNTFLDKFKADIAAQSILSAMKNHKA